MFAFIAVRAASARGRAFTLCAVIFGLLTAAPSAMAAIRYVDPGGSDGAACSQAAPCATLGRAYSIAVAGDDVQVGAGVYSPQEVPRGAKAVTFRGAPGAKLRELDNFADNVTYDGIEVDSNFEKVSGFENRDGANVTFKNGRIGNVTDEKGALISGTNFTFDNVVFHDVRLTNETVHNECVYAIGVPGMTVRNSTFYACATMDLFFTYGDWWTPLPPAYGGVTVENNVFAHSTMQSTDSWHYYSLYVGNVASGGGALTNWVVRNNTFEIAARVSRQTSTGSRWAGNLGSWDCVAGVTYRHNVGKKCAGTDKAVTPDVSTRARVAAFGWVNPAINDFHLLASSPAIGAADPGDAPATDRDGKTRDAAPDAGAYEYDAGSKGTSSTLPPGQTRGALGTAIRVRSARLTHKAICMKARKRCPSSAKLRIKLSAPGKVAVRIERLRRRATPRKVRTVRFTTDASHTTRIKARWLGPGRYRIVVVATSAAGQKSKAKAVRMRVRVR